MLVSWNSRLGFLISKLDLFEAQVLFRFCLITQRSLSLPDLSRKIERPLLARYKLTTTSSKIDLSRDALFWRSVVLDILTNPEGQRKAKKKRERERKIKIDLQKKVQILAFAPAWKTKKRFNYIRLVKKCAFFLAKSIFSHSYSN